MFIFALIVFGFIVWASASGNDDKTGHTTATAQRQVARPVSTSVPKVVKAPNYSRPQSTVAYKRSSLTSTLDERSHSAHVASVQASSKLRATYVPRTEPTFNNTLANPIIDPAAAAILASPAVSVISSSSIPTARSKAPNVKDEHQEILRLLKENGVVYLYHFTDRRNLESIRRNGGLFSWQSCKTKGIQIPFAGGDISSRMLDTRYGLQDYVRLSLCDDHPMMWRLKQNGYDLVLLKIKIDAALLRDTLYSDMNATDGQHSHGGSLQDLKKIRFSATKRRYVRRDDADFKYHQAEVMVKTFIPAEYIVNLDYPQAA